MNADKIFGHLKYSIEMRRFRLIFGIRLLGFGEEPLVKLVSTIVGLEAESANEVFSEFLSDEKLNANQREFVKLIVHYVIKNGIIDKNVLNDHPFSKYGSVIELFDDKLDVVKGIVDKIDALNGRVEVG